MSDDDRFRRLFAGAKGSVLGSFADDPAPVSGTARAKERAAAEKRLPPRRARGPRLPPGQAVAGDWPVLDLGHRPDVPTDRWTLEIMGAVARPLKLDWAAFTTLPPARIDADIHCVTAWSMLDNVWEGVATRTLLDIVAPHPNARHVVLHAHDGYRTNVRLERFQAANALLARARNGTPLSRDHGGPVRVVIPDLYFWKSAKWVRRITILEHGVKGYWEALGYHDEGDPWREQRYA